MEAIPVIDVSGLSEGGPKAFARLAREIGAACGGAGFFQAVGHGLSLDYLDSVMAAARRFFTLPQPQKDALKISAQSDNRGYAGLRAEALDPGINVDQSACLAPISLTWERVQLSTSAKIKIVAPDLTH